MTAALERFDDDLAAFPVFEVNGDRVRLFGSRCARCGTVAFPRRLVCLDCGGDQEGVTLGGAGVLHSWTMIRNPPAGFAEGFAYGVVDLVEGPRILSALRGEPRIGAPVRAVPDVVRDGHAGFRFKVVDA